MKIIEYEEKYLEDVRDLLVELEKYILSIDEDELDQLHPDYREKMAVVSLNYVRNSDGKCYLALDGEKVIGLIMGVIHKYDDYDHLDYKCPKKGIITELVVTEKARSTGVGQELMNKMEDYFRSVGCEYSGVEVFAYNKNAINFYEKRGYHSRCYLDIKKL